MSKHYVPLAILGAGALIGFGLFLGLSQQQPRDAQAPSRVDETRSARPAPVPASAPTVTETAPADATRDAVARAIDKLRSELVESCWKPLAAKAPEPKSVKLTFNGTIGADGKSAAYGISEHREAFRPGLAECVQQQLAKLKVAPPRVNTEVSVEFELP